MTFDAASIWFLLLLLAVPVLVWRMFRKRRGGLRYSSTKIIESLEPTLRTRLRWIVPALRIAAIVLLIVSLARPQQGLATRTVDAEGIAIELVVDRSGSMRATDFMLGTESVNRLTAVKHVAERFVAGDEQLPGRHSDLVGLVTFAGIAESVAPPTLDHGFVIGRLNEVTMARRRGEDGTAVGDALGLAIEKLQSLEESRKDPDPLKSKVVILLTDGDNNAGQLDPLQAAELAATLGVKVYAIGVGTQGVTPAIALDPDTGQPRIQLAAVGFDEASLMRIAEITGGRYYRASDTETLRSIYADIDRLEKSRFDEQRYTDSRELAIEWLQSGRLLVPPLALVALVLLGLQAVLSQTVFRVSP